VYASQRRGVVLRIVRYAAPLAAAAAVVLAVVLWHNKPDPTSTGPLVAVTQVDDEVVVENLDFFKDFQVVDNYQTLQAIDDLEKASIGGEETPQGI
jgi:hypothetical protein